MGSERVSSEEIHSVQQGTGATRGFDWVMSGAAGSSEAPIPQSEVVDELAAADEMAGYGPAHREEESELGTLFASLQPAEFLRFDPGEPARVVASLHHGDHTAIYVSKRELILHNGMRAFRCRVPTTDDPDLAKLPEATKLVTVIIHHRAVGPSPARYVYALDTTESVVGKVDDSNTWEFRLDLLEEACQLVGIGYETKSFERFDELLAHSPNLAEPKLEFEAHHPVEEDVRELAMGFFYGGAVAAGLLSSGGMALVFVNPVDLVYRVLVVAGCIVMCALTAWSLSQRRMRRSLRRARSTVSSAP